MKVLLEIGVSVLLVLIEIAAIAVIVAPRAVARRLRTLVDAAIALPARRLERLSPRSRVDRRPLQPPHEAH
jgi:hypothetical protein